MLMDSYIFSILYKLIHFSSLKPCNTQNGQLTKYSVLDVENKKSLNPNLYFIACFPKFLQISHQFRLIISYINLKYTFNIPFRITLKTIIMGTSSQFHDGAQLKFYPHLAQRYYTLLDWVQETFVKAWSSLLNNNGNLNVQFN